MEGTEHRAQSTGAGGGRVLAIDLGERRIGLAVSDPERIIGSPAGVIVRRRGKKIPVARLVAKAEEIGATEFVVGLPLDGEGEDTPRAADARWLASELTRRTGKAAQLVDERYTTAKARRAIREMGGEAADRRGDVDALAAAVLLQYALDLAR